MRVQSFAAVVLAAAVVVAGTSGATAATVVTGNGTITGTFITPTPSGCIPSSNIQSGVVVPVCDGVGSNYVSWGDPAEIGIGQSSLTFIPATFTNITQGDVFPIGTLMYFNGTTLAGSSINQVVLSVVSSSTTPELDGQTLLLPFSIQPTVNGGIDPIADADYVYFSNAVQFGNFHVLESNLAAVQLLGRFGSLHNEGFGQITGGTANGSGFLSAPGAAIPEPPASALIVTALALLCVARRRRV